MKTRTAAFYAALGLCVGNLGSVASAQSRLLLESAPQCVFSGQARSIATVWHNPGEAISEAEIRARLLQTSSATAARLEDKFWKKLEMLPGQTVLETAPVDFPVVNSETTFLIQWLTDTNLVSGQTEVLVYPTNLLSELKLLLHGEMVGVLDANGVLKPSLKQNGVGFLDLEEMALEDFSGKLAIIGPFQSKAQMREGLAQTIQRIARKGVAVVWIQPPPDSKDEIKPSFYLVPEGKGAVVVVQSDFIANFSENPKSQLNLIHFCKLALHPAPLPLPDFSSEP